MVGVRQGGSEARREWCRFWWCRDLRASTCVSSVLTFSSLCPTSNSLIALLAPSSPGHSSLISLFVSSPFQSNPIISLSSSHRLSSSHHSSNYYYFVHPFSPTLYLPLSLSVWLSVSLFLSPSSLHSPFRLFSPLTASHSPHLFSIRCFYLLSSSFLFNYSIL